MKIPIPKEAVTRIMKDYSCSEEEAAKAFLDAQDRANEEFKRFLKERFGPSKSSADELVPKVYTPRNIKQYLYKFVIGQEEYKKRLAIAGGIPKVGAEAHRKEAGSDNESQFADHTNPGFDGTPNQNQGK